MSLINISHLTFSDRPVLSMVTTMLDKAFDKIPDGTELILHSDQGWQYQHKQYQHMLRKKGVRQSMSQRKLSRQCRDGKFLWSSQKRTVLSPRIPIYGTLQTGTHWIPGLLQQPPYQAKVEGLAACSSQTTSPFSCLNNISLYLLSNFLGAVHYRPGPGLW